MLASLLGFTGAVAALSTIDSDHYLKHEMSCDKLAASFVNGEALVEAIGQFTGWDTGWGVALFVLYCVLFGLAMVIYNA